MHTKHVTEKEVSEISFLTIITGRQIVT